MLFNATAIGNVADNAGTSPLTDLQVALHTADPGETGDQSTNECTYTSYDRVAVARTSGGWTVTGNLVENTAEVLFPEATGGSETATHFSVGQDTHPTGGNIFYSGALGSSQAIASGTQPRFPAGTIDITED